MSWVYQPQSGRSGADGADGKSAYEIAKENGFPGTEQEWLDSLVGADGEDAISIHILGELASTDDLPDTGSTGDAYLIEQHLWVWSDDSGQWVDAGPVAGPPGEDGSDGKSAYEIAKENGFPGTEEEWLASLQGEPGEDGKDAISIHVLGELASTDDLPDTGNPGDGWMIEQHLWLWSEDTGQWIDAGPVAGPPGEDGDEGPEGPPGPPRDSLYGDLQPADPNQPSYDDSWLLGGETGWVLTKKSNADRDAEWAAPTGGFFMPPGIISPFMGTTAPDGWLLCDGSEYDPADLPELYAVNSAFHNDSTFRVPDLRGRSPIGTGKSYSDIPYDFTLGDRVGDYIVAAHTHRITVSSSQTAEMCGWPGSGGPNTSFIKSQAEINNHNVGAPDHRLIAGFQPNWYTTAPFDRTGQGDNHQPSTVTNFIVYAGRSTAGISPLGTLAPMTTRMMIESRLAKAGIGEEEVKMLKEQLEALKTAEAK